MMTLQNQFLREKTFENYDNNSVLECLLSTAGVRGDIPVMINNLYDAFGSFKNILEARPVQLMQVPSVTKKTATLISMVAPLAKVWEHCTMENPGRIGNCREAEAYCKSLLMGERAERFYVLSDHLSWGNPTEIVQEPTKRCCRTYTTYCNEETFMI